MLVDINAYIQNRLFSQLLGVTLSGLQLESFLQLGVLSAVKFLKNASKSENWVGANLPGEYTIEDIVSGERSILEESKCDNNLGVYISNDLKWRTHAQGMVGKANKALGILKRSFVSRESKLWKNLYTSLVRPHLEYTSSVWELATSEGDRRTWKGTKTSNTNSNGCL